LENEKKGTGVEMHRGIETELKEHVSRKINVLRRMGERTAMAHREISIVMEYDHLLGNG
jgi:hypothetical protein